MSLFNQNIFNQNLFNPMQDIKVYAFIGPSGTGKSYRAQMVANEYNINYIIDDGILIKENDIIAGSSEKKAPKKIETVKKAIFINEQERNDMKKGFRQCTLESFFLLCFSASATISMTSASLINRIDFYCSVPFASSTSSFKLLFGT